MYCVYFLFFSPDSILEEAVYQLVVVLENYCFSLFLSHIFLIIPLISCLNLVTLVLKFSLVQRTAVECLQ
jgi:hypothetical protein